MVTASKASSVLHAESSASSGGLFGTERLANVGADSHISGLRLQQSLTIDQAKSIFTASGDLSPEVIKNSDLIIPGTKLSKTNTKLLNALSNVGGNLTDWGKYATKLVDSPSGEFEMHFYYNPVLDKAYYGMDYKAIFRHQGQWNLEPTPNFIYNTPNNKPF